MGILSEMDMMNRDAEDDAFEVSSDSETVDSFSEEFEPVEPPKPDPQAEDAEEARKKAEFDAAEAKRKAEWEAKQAQKKLREQQELDRLAAMSDDDVMQASMNRVSQDTERLTRRNMKLCVMEDVQTECLADPAFARLVMNPKKKMLNCFHYINRKAREYLEQEMKDNDEKPNLRSRQELLQWQLKNHVHTVPTQWFAYMTARKFMRYMDSQLPDYMQLKRAFLYRSPMEEAISTYSDYLQMCQEQNYDMKSSQVLFPKHCNEAHDELSRYIKKCRDEQTKRAFREVYEHLAEKANLTSKKLQIVCPKQTDDLIAEGQALHHCVGTYIERVAAKKCLIVFVRRVEEPKKPYVTVEVRNGKIEQIHGDHNSDPTEEVKKFVDLWSRKVLPMALQAA